MVCPVTCAGEALFLISFILTAEKFIWNALYFLHKISYYLILTCSSSSGLVCQVKQFFSCPHIAFLCPKHSLT
jgi:hypothetical protein